MPLLAQWGNAVTLDVSLDWRVLTFAAAMGRWRLPPAASRRLSPHFRRRLGPSLADGGRSASSGRRRALMRRGLVTAQFALSLALLVVATLLVRTLHNLRTLPTGFDIDHLAVLEVDPSAAQYSAARTPSRISTRGGALAAVPGVRAVGFARVLPLDFGGSRTSIAIPGYQAAAGRRHGDQLQSRVAGLFRRDGHARRRWPGVRRHATSAGRPGRDRQRDDGAPVLENRSRRRPAARGLGRTRRSPSLASSRM